MFDFCSSTSGRPPEKPSGPLVVVVDGDREGALGGLLTDDVLLQDLVDLARLRKFLELDSRLRAASAPRR